MGYKIYSSFLKVSCIIPLFLIFNPVPTCSTCPPTQISTSLNNAHSSNIILNFYDFRQEWMDYVFENFSRMRDYYSRLEPEYMSCKQLIITI